MPPPESHLTLSADERRLLVRWIEQGADYEPHWAFVPVPAAASLRADAAPPATRSTRFVRPADARTARAAGRRPNPRCCSAGSPST